MLKKTQIYVEKDPNLCLKRSKFMLKNTQTYVEKDPKLQILSGRAQASGQSDQAELSR